ncbi:neugrin [Cololabis saira]|uniref:neugrin n=1 Tax=Cololabis saira TaxID=129043 RepID=UPI002AD5055D|nr:neugrin [Cololabis saira]
MARPLQVLSFLSRLRNSLVTPSVSHSCGFSSRGPSQGWLGRRDGEGDLDEVEDKLQELMDEGKKRQKTVKYHMVRKKMTPSGAPERRLSWDAIEQIRYLKKEQPEEWTVERLAEGFCVTPDAILRVLRSKFTPSLEKKAKQDAKVMARLGQQVLPSGAGTQQDQLKLAGNSTTNMLLLGSMDSALVPVSGQTQVIQGRDSGSPVRSLAPVTVPSSQLTAGINEDAMVTTSTVESITGESPEEEDEDGWDGVVLTEEELEEFMEMEKPSPVVQLGNEFFDAEGNLLYRI